LGAAGFFTAGFHNPASGLSGVGVGSPAGGFATAAEGAAGFVSPGVAGFASVAAGPGAGVPATGSTTGPDAAGAAVGFATITVGPEGARLLANRADKPKPATTLAAQNAMSFHAGMVSGRTSQLGSVSVVAFPDGGWIAGIDAPVGRDE
jgi:hypothetical protein